MKIIKLPDEKIYLKGKEEESKEKYMQLGRHYYENILLDKFLTVAVAKNPSYILTKISFDKEEETYIELVNHIFNIRIGEKEYYQLIDIHVINKAKKRYQSMVLDSYYIEKIRLIFALFESEFREGNRLFIYCTEIADQKQIRGLL